MSCWGLKHEGADYLVSHRKAPRNSCGQILAIDRACEPTGLSKGRPTPGCACYFCMWPRPAMSSGGRDRDMGEVVTPFLTTLRSATLAGGYMQSYPINLRRNLCGSGSPQQTASRACCHPGVPRHRVVGRHGSAVPMLDLEMSVLGSMEYEGSKACCNTPCF